MTGGELERIFVERFNCDGEAFEEWVLENTLYTFCEDLSGDCFVLYNNVLYIINFGEFVEIEEIDLNDKERVLDIIEHLEEAHNPHLDNHAKEIIQFLKSYLNENK